jgi:hypothetical protein
MVTSAFEGHLSDLLEVEGSLTDTPMLCADTRQGVLRLPPCRWALWDAAMTGDISAVVAVVKIVQARVRLNGLDCARTRLGAVSETPRTLVVPPTS